MNDVIRKNPGYADMHVAIAADAWSRGSYVEALKVVILLNMNFHIYSSSMLSSLLSDEYLSSVHVRNGDLLVIALMWDAMLIKIPIG